MAAVSNFPLLQLSDKAILRTVQLMNIAEILGLSLTSKKCKQLVIHAKNKANFLQVIIGNTVTFIVKNSKMEMWLAFSTHDDEPITPGQKKSLSAPSSIKINLYYLKDPIEVQMDPWVSVWDFDFKNWLDHIQSIFHRPKTIDYVQFELTLSQFDLKEIKEVFGKTDGLDVQHTGCYAYNQLILQEFLPVKHFSVDTGVFQDSRISPNLLIQHFETFIIGFHSDDFKTIDLDDLLAINSKHIDILGLEISPKVFNTFLKLWIKGAMPQLEYLSILFNGEAEENEVMKGIKYQKFPSERRFSRFGEKEYYFIKDGMDFYGKDGLKAVVQINYEDLENYFELFVHHDHCYVISEGEN